MNEKEAIEKATADAFIELYNSEMDTSFSISEYSDAPDIRCKDQEGNSLNLEITQTEDQPGDIQTALGRSDQSSLEALEKHNAAVREYMADRLEGVNLLQGNVSEMIAGKIQPKLSKDYGLNAALVIRDSSRTGWDWNLVADQIISLLDLKHNPYDKGIWIITNSKDRIFRLL